MYRDVITIADQLPRHKTKRYEVRALATIRRTVIHHSVTEIPEDATTKEERAHLRRIAKRHVGILDWPGIGYHYCIFRSGRIYEVNHIWTVSYHVANFNHGSLGICLIGNMKRNDPSGPQVKAARWLCMRMGLRVEPHKKFNKTACPGNWDRWGPLVRP